MINGKNKRYLTFALQMIAVAVLTLVDQLIKKAAVTHLMGQDDIILVVNFLALSYAENTGAAFSMFSDSTMVLSVVTLIMLIAGVVYLFVGKKGKIMNICTVCIIAGGTGNLIDRFAQGYVVDYIKTLFIDFPVFNFADILVVCGTFVLCGMLVYEIIQEEKQKKQEKSNGNS